MSEEEMRCCICLEVFTSLNDPTVFLPSCCLIGTMHVICGKQYVKIKRLSAEWGAPSPECPGCRQTYRCWDLNRLLPPRRLVKLEGLFHPLDDESRIQISVSENHGGPQKRHMLYDFGAAYDLPDFSQHNIHHLLAHCEQFKVPWPLYPAVEMNQRVGAAAAAAAEPRTENPPLSPPPTPPPPPPSPQPQQPEPTPPPPPQQPEPPQQQQPEPTPLFAITSLLMNGLKASETLRNLRSSASRVLTIDPVMRLTRRGRRLRDRRLKKVNNKIIRLQELMRSVNSDLYSFKDNL